MEGKELAPLKKMEAVEIKDPKGAAEWIAAAQTRINELIDRDDHRGQEFVNVNAMLAKAQEETTNAAAVAKAAEEIAKANARTVPSPLRESLEGIDFKAKADEETCRHLGVSKLDPFYWGIMSQTPGELRMKGADDRAIGNLREIWTLNDALVFENMRRMAGQQASHYMQNGGIRSIPLWASYERKLKEFRAANSLADATPALGAEYVPTILSPNLIMLIQAELRLAGFFETVPMTSANYDNPVEGADSTGYYIAESTTDAGTSNPITWSQPATAKMSLVAKKIAAGAVTSIEWADDSIIPASQEISRKIAKAVRRAIETAILNGQATGAIDTNDAPAATDARSAWDGLRYAWNATTDAGIDMGAGVTAEGLLGLKGKAKAYGLYPDEGLWVTGFSGYQRLLSLKDSANNAVVLTQEKAGVNATFPSGQLGEAFGSPIVVSEFMSEVLQATGLNTAGGGTKTQLLYVNRDAFRLGERRGLAVDMSRELYFKTYQLAFRAVWRGHFKSAFTANSSNKFVAAGVNITTY